MTRPGRPATAFCDKGFTFDQILHEGRLGGLGSLRTYVASRRAQLVRKLATSPAGSDAHRRCEAAHQAFVEVEALLPNLVNQTLAQKTGVAAAYLGRQKS